jgi:hypothetical protein
VEYSRPKNSTVQQHEGICPVTHQETTKPVTRIKGRSSHEGRMAAMRRKEEKRSRSLRTPCTVYTYNPS